jgi:hypothetical protein
MSRLFVLMRFRVFLVPVLRDAEAHFHWLACRTTIAVADVGSGTKVEEHGMLISGFIFETRRRPAAR